MRELRQADAGLDRVNVQDVRPLLCEPAKQVRGSPQGHTMVDLVARRLIGDRVAEHRHTVVLVLFGRASPRIGCGDQHLVPRLLQTAAQAVDVHLGATDTVGKIPTEQMNDLHWIVSIRAGGRC